MDELKNNVAVITGAASGIGRAAVALFAREGAADVTDDAGQERADEIGRKGGSGVYVAGSSLGRR
jgi:NAD(P)-dependent dehydrogenase (short-subunit alcohol dehydrogenase family)